MTTPTRSTLAESDVKESAEQVGVRTEDEHTTVTLTVNKPDLEMSVAETSGNGSVSLHHP